GPGPRRRGGGAMIKAKLFRFRIPKGIVVRTSVLSWLVTLLTLTIFVTGIIPQQKKDLEDALRSKARGISLSLTNVAAGAALSDDFSSLVDYCLLLLAGDEAIDFVVATRNDGFSVIIDRSGWRSEHLDKVWHPGNRVESGAIEMVPVIGRRVFHALRPFDYSGLEWGWIHVGLSLQSYDRSVARIYNRTGLLAIVCVCLSLIASMIYALRLVKPIASLEAVVRQVAGGNLDARAHVRGGDEVGSLAQSFNSMADSIHQRNRILESVRAAAQTFLGSGNWREVIAEVFARIGVAAKADRAYLFEGRILPDGALDGAILHQWTTADRRPVSLPMLESAGIQGWTERLRAGEVVSIGWPRPSTTSSVLVPIEAGDEWFGFLGYDNSTSLRVWTDAETDSFRTLAGMLGATITRQKAQFALMEVNETLELRVDERTRQLQEQVDAKERARAELAEAQHRLIDMSRLSGMAEVATGVLHNVGNVLNSVNVSTTIVADKLRESRLDNLLALIGMLEDHPRDLPEFLSRDPKGQRVIPYLGKLGKHLNDERSLLIEELRLLTGHVGHIKEIVATQQNYAKVSGLTSEVSLAELIEDAFRIIAPGFERHQITLIKEFEEIPVINADKHRMLQILLNLLRNAKQAIKDSNRPERVIRVRTRLHEGNRIRIEVEDSGIGLPQENLTRIFAHGFTTKPDGHGFGLHSGALAALEMGGSLWAESEGPGWGATFVLELPFVPANVFAEECKP
ncbi:MAG: ATP-binding protein, partial [Acidobacteria bacterium]|nr:ATP-binding protein [Acidobacteriota bacterium]